MANSRFYSSTALETTLTNSITPSTTIIQVAATTGFPGSLPFTIAIDYGAASMELTEVTAIAGLNLTITRAVDGTSAASHNAGAAVRHVSSARDFTDSRTHEAATSSVHGVTGDLVGTTSTQTLTNKTISGGTFTGTIAGSPTYSGAPVFSGAVTLSGGGTLGGTFAGTHTYSGAVTFSGVANLNAGGALVGTFSGSPTLSGTVTHSGLIQSTRAASTDVALAAQVSGDTFDRFRILESGSQEWGSGSAARDTNLFRSAADTLRTDDSLVVGTNLTVSGTASVTGAATVGSLSSSGTISASNFPSGAWTSFTPTWTAASGTTTLGNGTLTGRYMKIGRTVFMQVKFQWGTTTTQSVPSANWSFALPVAALAGDDTFYGLNAWVLDASANARWTMAAYVDASTTTFTAITANADGGFMDSQEMPDQTAQGGSTTSIQPGSLTWADGDRLNVWGFYESAA